MSMSTCFFSMIPNGWLSYAMSGRDIGGNGRHPRDQRPSLGSPPVQSVRRKLFEVDHNQTGLDLQRELRQCEESDRNKYNFDFNSEQPITSSDSRYEWSQISTDSNDTEDKTDFNVSTKLCKTSDQNIAQSSTQSQSATSSSPPVLQPESHSIAVSSIRGSNSSQMPTSVTSAPDSQPQSTSSAVALIPKVGQKDQLVSQSKQMPITAFFDGRKSAESQRKRSAAQVLSHKSRATKRHRLECTSAVKPEDIDTTTTTDVTDTDVSDVSADEDRTTGTPV